MRALFLAARFGILSRAASAARRFPYAVRAAWRGDTCDCCGCRVCRCPTPPAERWIWTCECSRPGSAALRAARRAGRAWRRAALGRRPPPAVHPRLALWTAWL